MSTQESAMNTQREREKALFRYTAALDRGDFETVTAVLSLAEADAALAGMIAEVNIVVAGEVESEVGLQRLSQKYRPNNPSRRTGFRTSGFAVGTLLIIIILLVGGISGLVMLPMLTGGGSSYSGPVGEATSMPFGTATPAGTLAVGFDPHAAVPSDQQPVERMIIKNGEIEIVVQNAQIAMDQITQIATDNEGYVLSSQSWQDGEFTSATMTIGVHVDYFETAMRRIREISLDVLSELSTGQDVSTEFVDLQSRLRNLEATRDRIRAFLDQAESVEEALMVNQQLAEIEAQIEQVQGRMQYLSGRAAYSTITVQISEPQPTPTPRVVPTPIPWSLGEHIEKAAQTQVVLGRGLLGLLVWLIIVPGPYLIGVALIVLAVRAFRQRLK